MGRKEKAVATKKHRNYLCDDVSILSLDCINVNIQVVTLYIILENVTIGGN